MLKWNETPEVIRDHFEKQDEQTKRIGLHLLEEVGRLQGILKGLETQQNEREDIAPMNHSLDKPYDREQKDKSTTKEGSTNDNL
jgi:hypothetical protein